MDMDQAAVFLAGSVLTALGFLVILGALLIANNLVAKYWKSWGWHFYPTWMNDTQPRFMTQEEADRVAPVLKEDDGKSK